MNRLPDHFREDRALRDAARKILLADVEHARNALTGKAVAGRFAGRIGHGAKDVLDLVRDRLSNHQGIFAGFMALIVLWFARGPILDVLGQAVESATGGDVLDENGDASDTQSSGNPPSADHETHGLDHALPEENLDDETDNSDRQTEPQSTGK